MLLILILICLNNAYSNKKCKQMKFLNTITKKTMSRKNHNHSTHISVTLNERLSRKFILIIHATNNKYTREHMFI